MDIKCCFKVLTGTFVLFATTLLGTGCNAGQSCSPGHDQCTYPEACDPGTKECVPLKICTKNSDCGPYVCESGACAAHCALGSTPSDLYCNAGYKCQADFTCKPVDRYTLCQPGETDQCNGPICDPYIRNCVPYSAKECSSIFDPICGKYVCNGLSKVCAISCNDDYACQGTAQCNSNHVCW